MNACAWQCDFAAHGQIQMIRWCDVIQHYLEIELIAQKIKVGTLVMK